MIPKDDSSQAHHNSHLFMIRMWLEDLGDGKSDWRGRIQHVNSGEVRYFHDWCVVKTFMVELLDRGEVDGCSIASETEIN